MLSVHTAHLRNKDEDQTTRPHRIIHSHWYLVGPRALAAQGLELQACRAGVFEKVIISLTVEMLKILQGAGRVTSKSTAGSPQD